LLRYLIEKNSDEKTGIAGFFVCSGADIPTVRLFWRTLLFYKSDFPDIIVDEPSGACARSACADFPVIFLRGFDYDVENRSEPL
jgi:hypothetical protein